MPPTVSQRSALNSFLADVQGRALRQAELATQRRDDALDIVQDAMLKLARHYGNKDAAEWPLLFQRILQNQIRDWARRQKVRRIFFWWDQQDNDQRELSEIAEDQHNPAPDDAGANEQVGERLQRALQQLPLRQQQVFLLRALWEHDTAETAHVMGCSTGSVKTHYSRATARLKTLLEGVEL